MSLDSVLATRIRQSGPMSVADFMADCLLHPRWGYYVTRDPLGAAGDFTTAPEISQMFGELIGLCLAQSWLDQGAPPAILAEAGSKRIQNRIGFIVTARLVRHTRSQQRIKINTHIAFEASFAGLAKKARAACNAKSLPIPRVAAVIRRGSPAGSVMTHVPLIVNIESYPIG